LQKPDKANNSSQRFLQIMTGRESKLFQVFIGSLEIAIQLNESLIRRRKIALSLSKPQ